MNIEYRNDLGGITEDMLAGFFVGWLNPPDSATHLRVLRCSYCAFIAVDCDCNRVVGFINAISDGVLSAYIPLLEVLPEYQGKGVGRELVKRMVDELNYLYMIDIAHDEELTPYYARFGALPGCSSIFRNYAAQSGNSPVVQ